MTFPSKYSTQSLQLIPSDFAKKSQILPFATQPPSFFVSSETPLEALSELSRNFGKLALKYADVTQVKNEIIKAYEQTGNAERSAVYDIFDNESDLSKLVQDIPLTEELSNSDADAPIIRMINVLLRQAYNDQASDIHIEPFEESSIVRFRIDGVLRDIVRPPAGLHPALISRIKIMAQLDIAEKRLPQDGRVALKINKNSVDVRVSTLPTGYGERAVLRLLDKSSERLNLEHLGMGQKMRETFDTLLKNPYGIILVTGPTGSGKSTTLYAGLSTMNTADTNIMTVEDPIEYDLQGIGQTQVNSRIDMTFSRALRAILRQDPDVIMIGEIRDLETAQIAVQASLTGHLVLATLHTNDASAAITRLIDMGIEPFLLASSLSAVLAQRLVRKVCPSCNNKESDVNDCENCGGSGYLGRTGVYELLTVDTDMRSLIHDQASEDAIRTLALKKGMKSMRKHGMQLVKKGITTEVEVLRATKN